MDATRIAAFDEFIVQPTYEPDDLGFKDLRLGLLPVDRLQSIVWNWLGNHGCFIGKEPLGEGYASAGLTAAETTPFECLYYVYRGPARPPILAHRLRPDVIKRGPCYDGKQSRVYDPMECLSWDTEAPDVTIYTMTRSKSPPERTMDISEDFLLAHFQGAVQKWV